MSNTEDLQYSDIRGNRSYIESLKWKLQSLEQEQQANIEKLRELQDSISRTAQMIEKVQQLLAAEGVPVNKETLGFSAKESVSDICYKILQELGTPLHYKDLAKKVLSNGIIIVGKDPAANLIAHLSRDGRFERVAGQVRILV